MNPLVIKFFRYLLPYAVAFGLGFSAAFYIQGIRIQAAKNEFEAYKTEQQRLKNEAEIAAEKRRKETADEYERKLKELGSAYDGYRRCVALGKCNGLQPMPGGTGSGISAPGKADGASANPVPAAGGVAPEVIGDCMQTTLQLNTLQADIEKQYLKEK